PAVAVTPPAGVVVVKPQVTAAPREAQPRAGEHAARHAVTRLETAIPAPAEVSAAAVEAAEATAPALESIAIESQAAHAPVVSAEFVAAPEAPEISAGIAAQTEIAAPVKERAARTPGHTHTAAPTHTAPIRRVVMPQTGPR